MNTDAAIKTAGPVMLWVRPIKIGLLIVHSGKK